MIKFLYSEKATKFFEISTIYLACVVPVKSAVEISQNFVPFSEYMNFTIIYILSSASILWFDHFLDYRAEMCQFFRCRFENSKRHFYK